MKRVFYFLIISFICLAFHNEKRKRSYLKGTYYLCHIQTCPDKITFDSLGNFTFEKCHPGPLNRETIQNERDSTGNDTIILTHLHWDNSFKIYTGKYKIHNDFVRLKTSIFNINSNAPKWLEITNDSLLTDKSPKPEKTTPTSAWVIYNTYKKH